MTTGSGQHVSDYMHRQLEVVPQDASVVPSPPKCGSAASARY